jgi:hypothetical protein
LAKKEMAALNEKAKIEYVGAFADMKKDTQAASPEVDKSKSDSIQTGVENSSEAANAATINDVPSKTESSAKSKSDSAQSSIDKGLAGF